MFKSVNFTADNLILPHAWDAKKDKGTNGPLQKPALYRVPEEHKSHHRHRKAASTDYEFLSNFAQNLQKIADTKQCRIDLKTQRHTLASCFLKTKNQRFKEFVISYEGSTVNFSRHNTQTSELETRHSINLEKAHVK